MKNGNKSYFGMLLCFSIALGVIFDNLGIAVCFGFIGGAIIDSIKKYCDK